MTAVVVADAVETDVALVLDTVTLGGGDVETKPQDEVFKGKGLSWSGVNFQVGEKKILKNVWGKIPAGKICAIIGPSGSGKSSLLNLLSGRVNPSKTQLIDGVVKIGDKVINPVEERKNIAYVMQDDALFATSTPREAMAFSANLRLDDSKNKDVDAIVEVTLKELGLLDCADTMIGGELIKGISGGQRKRVSVGVEIINKPSILFCDEPTSGLDSFSAYNCVHLLRDIAHQGSTVLCTIHQPSSEVFNLFDWVVIMKEGVIQYQGPLDEMNAFYAANGFPLPPSTNPADHAMFTVQQNTIEELEKSGMIIQEPVSSSAVDVMKRSASIEAEVPACTASFYAQTANLVEREVSNVKRDTAALMERFGVTIFLNILFGLVFYDAGRADPSDETDLSGHFGALSLVVISGMFGAAQPALLAIPFERPIFLREYSTGTYSIIPYFISKVVIELPLVFVQTVVLWACVHWLIGFQGSFILHVLVLWLLGVVSASVAVCLGCVVKDVKQATEMLPLVLVPQLLFAGVFVRTSSIPDYLRWSQYVCSLKYAMNLQSLVEFGPDTCDHENCAVLLDDNDINEDGIWYYILVMVGLFIGFRVWALYLLASRAKTVF